jgi:hypothetical protein
MTSNIIQVTSHKLSLSLPPTEVAGRQPTTVRLHESVAAAGRWPGLTSDSEPAQRSPGLQLVMTQSPWAGEALAEY